MLATEIIKNKATRPHRFLPNVADELGILPALMLCSFTAKTAFAEGQGIDYYDGITWFRTSVDIMEHTYRYCNADDIDEAFYMLIKDGYIISQTIKHPVYGECEMYALTNKAYTLME